MTNLTPKQQRIYDFIRTFTRQMGYPPTCLLYTSDAADE